PEWQKQGAQRTAANTAAVASSLYMICSIMLQDRSVTRTTWVGTALNCTPPISRIARRAGFVALRQTLKQGGAGRIAAHTAPHPRGMHCNQQPRIGRMPLAFIAVSHVAAVPSALSLAHLATQAFTLRKPSARQAP